MKEEIFIRKFTNALQDGNAAVFAGAGTSVDAGAVNWKDLVRPFSEEINLDVEKESDLVGLTQYYINCKGGNRGQINQQIVRQFSSINESTEVMDLLTRLPIYTYWTTNYDKVIENGLKNNNRRGDIKRRMTDLSTNVSDRDAIVYKMHGDIDSPDDAVISKDDYEKYNEKKPLFITALRGDLVSKTFLFVGFSFEDPNLESILGKVNVLLGENKREHYCFQKKVSKRDYDSDEDYQYAVIKQELKIKDLVRYGIETVLVDEYEDILEILKRVEEAYLKNTVFISGSISEYNDEWSKERVDKYCYDLSRFLVSKNYRIISGFGVGIGSSIINGALDEIYKSKYRHVNEHLLLFPFPQNDNSEENKAKCWTMIRKQMIKEAGVCVFIFGNKKTNDKIEIASGMLEEFQIAKDEGKIIIPIASTGFAAKNIFDQTKGEGFDYLDRHRDILEEEKDCRKVFSKIDSIIKGA